MRLSDLCDIVGYVHGKVYKDEVEDYYTFAGGKGLLRRRRRAEIRHHFSDFIFEMFESYSELGRRLFGARGIGAVMKGPVPKIETEALNSEFGHTF